MRGPRSQRSLEQAEIVGEVQLADALGKAGSQHVSAKKLLLFVRLDGYRQKKTAFDEIEILGDLIGMDEVTNARGDRLPGAISNA